MGILKFFHALLGIKVIHITKPKKTPKNIHISHYNTFPPKSGLQRGFHSNSRMCLQTQNNSHVPKEINQNTEYLLFFLFNKTLLSRGAVAICQHIWISLSELFNSDSHISLLSVFFSFLKANLFYTLGLSPLQTTVFYLNTIPAVAFDAKKNR